MQFINHKIPLYKPTFLGNEKKYVNECLDDIWISGSGKFVCLFEKKFAEYVGINYTVAVSNGTAALHLALLVLDIKAGDEVIVPTFTYVASVNVIKYCNAIPVFVDSLADTLQMNPDDIEHKITKKTKAIIAPHLYGSACDMNQICEIAEKNNLFIIEDVAEAFGTKYHDQHVGTFGDVATYSFFGNKTITCGEGGMVTTNNSDYANKIYQLKSQGLASGKEYYHDIIGYNYRMTNIAAAIGLAQLEKADLILKKKRKIAYHYNKSLKKNCPNISLYTDSNKILNSYWMCCIIFENAKIKEMVRKQLKKNYIDTRPFFCPVHLMPIYEGNIGDFPVAENISTRGINLPSWVGLAKNDIDHISNIIAKTI